MYIVLIKMVHIIHTFLVAFRLALKNLGTSYWFFKALIIRLQVSVASDKRFTFLRHPLPTSVCLICVSLNMPRESPSICSLQQICIAEYLSGWCGHLVLCRSTEYRTELRSIGIVSSASQVRVRGRTLVAAIFGRSAELVSATRELAQQWQDRG